MISKEEERGLREKVKKEFIENQFKNWQFKAKEYAEDKSKASELLKEAMQKAEVRNETIGEIWEKLQLLLAIFKDWLNGDYKRISKGSIMMIIIGLVYFVMPVDIIPDWIVGLGFLDDAAVLSFIIKQINDVLEEYKKWKQAGTG
ncbi:MAG: YkvA family protein [Desulfotomaculaceae bacterium]|nr:YkvA family protein [Desulfotomaculaceae bacterium]